jgi:hypothetical protein
LREVDPGGKMKSMIALQALSHGGKGNLGIFLLRSQQPDSEVIPDMLEPGPDGDLIASGE